MVLSSALLVSRALRSLLALVVTLVIAPAWAAAQGPLAAADRAYDEGQLAGAARAYEGSLATGTLDPAALIRAHLRLGILAALDGDDAASDAHFAIALALDPVRDAPEELSPELRARFEALRVARDGRRLALVIERGESGGPRVDVRDVPDGLARTIVVRGGAGFEQRFAWEGTPIDVDVPHEALPVEAFALDANGNRLARAGARITVPVAVEEGAPTPALREGEASGGGRSLIESPWLWIVVGTIVLGIAVAVGVSASGDRYVLDAPVVR